MIDARAHAALIAGYCLDVQAGEQVVVETTTLAAPLVLALQREILARDAWPLLRVALPGQDEGWWASARDVHLDGYPPMSALEARNTDARVMIYAPANASALAGVDPARVTRAARARMDVRAAGAERRWCITLWPVAALAQQAGMSTHAFEDLVTSALFLDQPDPVAAWGALRERQARLIDTLAPAREIRIQAPGTDLTLDVTGRTWVNSDGKRNLPSGEVFTGPHETSANGTVHFTIPTGPAGVPVAGVRLRFADGVVVDASADRGEDVLLSSLETDAGARRLGEIGIGTNTGITRNTGMILLDEKIGGTVHLALGRSYPETGGCNDSALHWDLICDLRDGGQLLVDGSPLHVR